MVEEAIEAVLHLWSSDPPYHFDGKYWKIHLEKTVDTETGNVSIPLPYQKIPPADCDPRYEPQLAQHTYRLLRCDPALWTLPGSCQRFGRQLWNTWKWVCCSRFICQPDRSDWKIARSIFIADTTKEAQQRARTNSLGKCFEYIGRL